MRPHSDAHDAELGDSVTCNDVISAGLFNNWIEKLTGLVEVAFVNSEGQISRLAGGNVLHDHIDDDIGGRDGTEDMTGDARAVRHATDSDLGLFAIHAYPPHNHVLHIRGLFCRQSSRAAGKT